MNLNKAFILGNVTKDPEVRNLPSGQQVTSFSIATNRFYTQNNEKKQEVEFHNIVAFGKLADIASRYLTKGSSVFIEGRIKTRNWVNTQGAKQYRTEVIAETLQLGPKTQGTGASPSSNYGKPAFGRQPEPDMPKQDEIPIIEENYPMPADNNSANEKVTFDDEAADEIDIKDIPF